MVKTERADEDSAPDAPAPSTSSANVKTEAGVKRERGEGGHSNEGDSNKRARLGVPAQMEDLEEFIVPKYEIQEIEGYTEDTSEYQLMKMMNLPTRFTNAVPSGATKNESPSKKAEKNKYWCNLCKCELTSDIARKNHVKGEKHLKLMRIQQQKQSDVGTDTQYWNRKVGKSLAGKKNVPINLSTKVMESVEPVIGLAFVNEYLAVSDPEMEPHYECKLCGMKGIANGMYNHVLGKKHRQCVLDYKFPDDPAYIDLNAKQLCEYAEKHAENMNADELITTERSDEKYPWPDGFQPWALENDGACVAPAGAKENFGITTVKSNNKFTIRKEILPHPDEIQPPTSLEETEKLVNFYQELVHRVTEFIGGERGEKLKNIYDRLVDQIREDEGLVSMKKSETSADQ